MLSSGDSWGKVFLYRPFLDPLRNVQNKIDVYVGLKKSSLKIFDQFLDGPLRRLPVA